MRAMWLLAVLASATACSRTALPGNQPSADEDIGDDDGDGAVNPAIVVAGQTSPTSNANLEHGMEAPAGVAVCNGRLVVVDQLHNRVLIWNSLPATGTPSLVLGQPDFTTRAANYAGIDARGLNGPVGVTCTNDALAVVDTGNSRVLVWRPLPATSFEAATTVMGQPDFSTNAAGTDSVTLNRPQGVTMVGNRIYVADTDNHRILIWNTIPIQSGTNANTVLGQVDFTSGAPNAGGAVSGNGFRTPTAMASDGTRFVAADTGNNRVLLWNNAPSAGMPPSFVLGQATFTEGTAPQSETLATLQQPQGLAFIGTTIIIADTEGNRLLGFSRAITANNQLADYAFGKSVRQGGILPVYDADTLASPRGIVPTASDVYVADSQSHRVVVLDRPQAAGFSSAKAVLGQTTLASGAKRSPRLGVDGTSLGLPMDVVIHGDQMLVVDFLYHRVLGWNAVPTSSGVAADFVLGQPDLLAYDTHDTQETQQGASGFRFPTAALVVNGDLHVVDRDFHRILVWAGVPTSNVPPTRVLGQPDFDTTDARAVADGTSFRQPTMLASDGTRFVVADQSNNRVLVWNGVPTDANDTADVILGQPTPDGVGANTGGLSASSLRSCRGVALTPNGIVIADTANNRVLIWNSMPTSNAAPADVVLGQDTMFTASGPPKRRADLPGPVAVNYADGLLFVANGHRITVWRGIPSVDNAPADYVIGQPSFDSNLANTGGLTIDRLQSPYNARVVGDDVFIADVENDRIIRKPKPTQ